jgi:predicted DNA-binding transcriptional regulator YafY
MSEPLPEKKPSLTELFDRDPLLLTNDDLEAMVAALRAQRHIWSQETQRARVDGRRRSSSVVKNPPLGNDAEF